MNSREPSIFDLSPSEKLQLVEDLWDDLASTPEDVPVHDWQKQELARRKANLQRNPASALPWAFFENQYDTWLMPTEKVAIPQPHRIASNNSSG